MDTDGPYTLVFCWGSYTDRDRDNILWACGAQGLFLAVNIENKNLTDISQIVIIEGQSEVVFF